MVYTSQPIKRLLGTAGRIVTRRKRDEGPGNSQLARVLGFFDLTLLGVGSTLGVGVYVLAGAVALQDAGPAVTLSFLVAAIASAFAGLCYAEFAARVPKAGSAYVYSYVTVGELAAFIIGWNLILEYVIGTASVARAFSNYVDTLLNNTMSKTLTEALPLNVSFLSSYPDFLSLGIVLVLTILLAWGVKESAWMNNIFTLVNLATVITVIVAGFFKIKWHNWSIAKSEIDPKHLPNAGEGGFMPFGIAGVMAGAAKCFFGFVGFDCVATTGEEAKNPQKHIPLAIITSLIIIFLAYFGISCVLTLMWPYYLQDKDAPLVVVFKHVNMDTVSVIVSAGAIFALCTSLFGCIFPMPRILYAMSFDGLLPQWCSKIYKPTQTPVLATFVSGIFAGIMGAIFQLDQLIDMMSIGTLLAYTIVALCVLLLRYKDSCSKLSVTSPRKDGPKDYVLQVINATRQGTPDVITTRVSGLIIGIFVLLSILTTFLLVYFENELPNGEPEAVIPVVISGLLTVLCIIILYLQPQDNPDLFFKVPLLPFLPCLSIFTNIYLMMKLDVNTWVRFGVWLAAGALIYLFYSIQHSVEGEKDRNVRENREKNKNSNGMTATVTQ